MGLIQEKRRKDQTRINKYVDISWKGTKIFRKDAIQKIIRPLRSWFSKASIYRELLKEMKRGYRHENVVNISTNKQESYKNISKVSRETYAESESLKDFRDTKEQRSNIQQQQE